MLVAMVLVPCNGQALEPYQQDFEGMTPGQGWPPNDLSVDGWQVFGIAWDANPYAGPANQIYQYGPFPAANGEPGSIQSAVTGEGGPDQGTVVLGKYSDYNNTDQTSLYIQALTVQIQTISASDIGLWRFVYDAKLGNLDADSSASAYIQTIDPVTFFQTAVVINDTTSLPAEWGTYTLDLLITPGMIGDSLSFGFSAIATNYNGSAVFYDNLSFSRVVDFDMDGIDDVADNCMKAANPDQTDTDGDAIGNACDPDIALPNDCLVTFNDLIEMRIAFFSTPVVPQWNPDADLQVDGVINFADLQVMQSLFFGPPGPSGLPNACVGQ